MIFKYIVVIVVAVALAQGAVYFHKEFVEALLYAKDDGTTNRARHIVVANMTLRNTTVLAPPTNAATRSSTSNATVQLHREEGEKKDEAEGEAIAEISADTQEEKKEETRQETREEAKEETKELVAENTTATTEETQTANQTHTHQPENISQTKSAITTEAPNAASTDIPRKPLAEMTEEEKLAAEEAFYKYHNQQMNLLVNDSSLIDWNRERRKKGKYSRWFEFFKYYEITKDQKSLENIEGLEKFRFFRHDKSLCRPAKLFTQYRERNILANNTKPRLRHVLLSKLNQDFGAFSTQMPGLTGRFGNLVKDWGKEGCTEEMIFNYINHPDTLAVFTNQFQIYDHPKVISITLGLSPGGQSSLVRYSKVYSPRRPNLLMLNMMDRGGRRSVMYPIIETFKKQANITLVNSYKNYGDGTNGTKYCDQKDENNNILVKPCYYREMIASKFIMSPNGLGLDCYRHWEAFFMGVIPILERNSKYKKTDGWSTRTLADLPLLWADNYENLTPDFLEREYARIVYQKDPRDYNYRKLTRQYWVDMANSIANGETVLTPTTATSRRRRRRV